MDGMRNSVDKIFVRQDPHVFFEGKFENRRYRIRYKKVMSLIEIEELANKYFGEQNLIITKNGILINNREISYSELLFQKFTTSFPLLRGFVALSADTLSGVYPTESKYLISQNIFLIVNGDVILVQEYIHHRPSQSFLLSLIEKDPEAKRRYDACLSAFGKELVTNCISQSQNDKKQNASCFPHSQDGKVICRGEFKDNSLDGVVLSDKGYPQLSRLIKDGKMIRKIILDGEETQLILEIFDYDNDGKLSTYTELYSNGEKKKMTIYPPDSLNTYTVSIWNKDGKPALSENIVDGKFDGKQSFYLDDCIMHHFYEKGTMIKREKWDVEGKNLITEMPIKF